MDGERAARRRHPANGQIARQNLDVPAGLEGRADFARPLLDAPRVPGRKPTE